VAAAVYEVRIKSALRKRTYRAFQGKKKASRSGRFLFMLFTSALADRADGALRCAGTAIDAGVRIDLILGIALRDRADGALGRTGTTADAGIIDHVCHSIVSFLNDSLAGRSRPFSYDSVSISGMQAKRPNLAIANSNRIVDTDGTE
jgi:hypothetical protein